jgi:hypothetical protein
MGNCCSMLLQNVDDLDRVLEEHEAVAVTPLAYSSAARYAEMLARVETRLLTSDAYLDLGIWKKQPTQRGFFSLLWRRQKLPLTRLVIRGGVRVCARKRFAERLGTFKCVALTAFW